MFDDEKQYHLGGRLVLMVVDQLWLWVLGNDTVFTSFTGRWSREDSNDIAHDTTDVFENLTLDRSQVRTPHDLAGKIMHKCLTSCLYTGTNTAVNLQFLGFYDTEIGRLADKEANLFKEFRLAVKRDPRATPLEVTNDAYEDDSFDVVEEIWLLEQIKDIQDELRILTILIRDQTSVISKFCILKPKAEYAMKAERTVRDYGAEVERITTHADHTYQALSDLVDLKQTSANVRDARSSRQQAAIAMRQGETALQHAEETARQGKIALQHAAETARQGRTLMVFTTVTIVFLPLSFMATFFAIQVNEFKGLSLAFVSKCVFPISLAFVMPLVFLALNMDTVSKFFGERFRKREREESSASLPIRA
ncbi:hypothetical protein Ptr902_09889 [Pyrenophora tritici-repentis]|nr:hypothetical protein L13192_08674 [Pyrenophora tritici-repentis]KAI2478923.1 hypothetical protein Ptr902_09889 [Pyrenophora tritici-repentis]